MLLLLDGMQSETGHPPPHTHTPPPTPLQNLSGWPNSLPVPSVTPGALEEQGEYNNIDNCQAIKRELSAIDVLTHSPFGKAASHWNVK